MFWPLLELVRPWRAALLLVLLACASPGRAAAECGNYVIILNGPAAAAPTATPDHPAPPLPCSGPNCSRKPEQHAPLPVPVAPTGPQGKDVTPAAGTVEPAHRPVVRAEYSLSARPIRRATAIFHPPQCG
ncbi:hypothetical protein [Limnoglobus roseus]|uniref:Uncharacterized protein n=1 Tax=Limnoglobus roseus TaxID=2598579 RepID=A0A5C1A5D3_9BACT|nr:hypothetical protein [Limnoglobus roseus]QEL13527.1 hypothetical protein PX52LOC_00385 [Limnoglobus roseus]